MPTLEKDLARLTLEKDSDVGPLSEELSVIQSSGWYHGPHGGYAVSNHSFL